MSLLKSMCGLSDAPRLWEGATDRLFDCGFVICPLHPCLFLSYRVQTDAREKKLDGAMGLHVDSVLGGGSSRLGVACSGSGVKGLKK
eukprot:8794574-Pyramimonas_sp.AAC.1